MRKFVIIKTIETEGKPIQKVLLTDGHSQILEIEGQVKADSTRDMFQENSDSGHSYEVKEIG